MVLGEGVGAGEGEDWGARRRVNDVLKAPIGVPALPLGGLVRNMRSLREEAGDGWCGADVLGRLSLGQRHPETVTLSQC